jgi:hypothetical protein
MPQTHPTQYDYLLFLIEHIPAWLDKLSTIRCDCIQSCHGHAPLFSPESPPYDPDAPLQAVSFATIATATTGSSILERPTMPIDIGTVQQLQTIKRKRRSSSIYSLHQPQQKYRMPEGLMVEYDAQAQKVFLEIVQDIDRGRKLIMRARAQARQQSFCKRGSQQAQQSDLEDDDDLDDDTVMTQVRLRRKRTNEASMCGDEAINNLQCCEHSDAHLHKAQDMCAGAAYQLLRDGECTSEIKRAVDELEDAFARVQQALIVLEEKGSNSPLAPSSFERRMAGRPRMIACAPLPVVEAKEADDQATIQ